MSADQTPDYSFITDPVKAKKSRFKFKSTTQKLIAYAVSGFFALAAIMILYSVIFGGGGGNTERLVGVVAQQNELIRVSAIGAKDATATETKNFATTVNLSLVTAENQLSGKLAQSGRKLKSADTGAAKNTKTDEALTTASQVNRFDEVFNQTMKTGLQTYMDSLKAAYNASSSKSEKALLQTQFNQAKILSDTVPAI